MRESWGTNPRGSFALSPEFQLDHYRVSRFRRHTGLHIRVVKNGSKFEHFLILFINEPSVLKSKILVLRSSN